ncbi:unnamed protein product [Ectocarpus sp. 13 AM-2016]
MRRSFHSQDYALVRRRRGTLGERGSDAPTPGRRETRRWRRRRWQRQRRWRVWRRRSAQHGARYRAGGCAGAWLNGRRLPARRLAGHVRQLTIAGRAPTTNGISTVGGRGGETDAAIAPHAPGSHVSDGGSGRSRGRRRRRRGWRIRCGRGWHGWPCTIVAAAAATAATSPTPATATIREVSTSGSWGHVTYDRIRGLARRRNTRIGPGHLLLGLVGRLPIRICRFPFVAFHSLRIDQARLLPPPRALPWRGKTSVVTESIIQVFSRLLVRTHANPNCPRRYTRTVP